MNGGIAAREVVCYISGQVISAARRSSENCQNILIQQTPRFPNALARGGRQKVDIYLIKSKWGGIASKSVGSKGLIYLGLEFGILEFAWRTILRIAHSL